MRVTVNFDSWDEMEAELPRVLAGLKKTILEAGSSALTYSTGSGVEIDVRDMLLNRISDSRHPVTAKGLRAKMSNEHKTAVPNVETALATLAAEGLLVTDDRGRFSLRQTPESTASHATAILALASDGVSYSEIEQRMYKHRPRIMRGQIEQLVSEMLNDGRIEIREVEIALDDGTKELNELYFTMNNEPVRRTTAQDTH